MKYIKEYVDINFDDWDELEEDPNDKDIKIGDRVYHNTLGYGTVVEWLVLNNKVSTYILVKFKGFRDNLPVNIKSLNMKYLKESIDFDDWDELEEDPNEINIGDRVSHAYLGKGTVKTIFKYNGKTTHCDVFFDIRRTIKSIKIPIRSIHKII